MDKLLERFFTERNREQHSKIADSLEKAVGKNPKKWLPELEAANERASSEVGESWKVLQREMRNVEEASDVLFEAQIKKSPDVPKFRNALTQAKAIAYDATLDDMFKQSVNKTISRLAIKAHEATH